MLYRLYRRGATFYCEHTETGKQESLKTANRAEALRLVAAKNEAAQAPYLNLTLGRTYLQAHDPELPNRTWYDVMDRMLKTKYRSPEPPAPSTVERCTRAYEQEGLRALRSRKLVETQPEDLKTILAAGVVSTNHYLGRLHSLAVKLGWLPWPILPPNDWPTLNRATRRAITEHEHLRIVEAEQNQEKRHFYELLWETGASQTDAARLTAENADWTRGALKYARQKTGSIACIQMGEKLSALLKALPQAGPLFPHLSTLTASDRSAEFFRRCRLLEIKGVSLHSYRYAWAERAQELGYPERWAQNALGHNSVSIHRHYAKHGEAVFHSLDFYEATAKSLAPNPIPEKG